MTCQVGTRPEVWEDFLGGSLPRAAAEQLERHLQSCEECRGALEAARRAGVLLRAAFEPAPLPTGAFWTRLRAQLRDAENGLVATGDFWGTVERLAWRLSFGAAALVVLLVGIVIGTQLPPRAAEAPAFESRDIFPEPVRQAVDDNDVLLELAAGRSQRGR